MAVVTQGCCNTRKTNEPRDQLTITKLQHGPIKQRKISQALTPEIKLKNFSPMYFSVHDVKFAIVCKIFAVFSALLITYHKINIVHSCTNKIMVILDF